jgi:HEAT repeat protein
MSAPELDDDLRKTRRVSPAAILLGLVLAGGAGAAVYMGAKTQSQKLTAADQAMAKKDIFVLPKAEQAREWRKWASAGDVAMQQEALAQLAWADDPESVNLTLATMKSGDRRVLGVAAQVLAYHGSPKADAGKPALLEALKGADESNKPQILWALVSLGEPTVFAQAMEEYRKGNLAKVERLGGGVAFDAEKLAALVSLDELAKLADDQSVSVRMLVASVLAANAEPKWTATLAKLVVDPDLDVGSQAANGLGKIGDEQARKPLLDALAKADDKSRKKFLEALKNGIGGEGLVLALESVHTTKPDVEWWETSRIFELIAKLADPRAGDALVRWVEAKPRHLHWVGEVGMRLAEVGDVRGAKYLARRLEAEPDALYKKENIWERDAGDHLSRSDLPRIAGARALADLAQLHPDKAAQLRADAEDSVLKWISPPRPQPHANGLRFLARVQSPKGLKQLREWAFPKDPLPKDGDKDIPGPFVVAQSALRYIGLQRDEASFNELLEQLKRKKDKKLDITQEGLMGAGVTALGMTLRAVAYGASEGLSHMGDPRAVKPLMEFVEDELWHAEAREAAARAIAWCGDEKVMAEVAAKAKDFASRQGERKQLIGGIYARALAVRPMPAAVPALVDLLSTGVQPEARFALARAIGASGFDAASEAKLFEKLKDVELRNAAALALVMGGSAETAARTVAMYGDFGKEALDELKDLYFAAYGFWTEEDMKRGNIYRYVNNAIAISRVKVADAAQDWATQRLQAQFNNLLYDNGPHTETRLVLRVRLLAAARSGDAAASNNAVQTLKFMNEQGSLMALKAEKGPVAELARRAYFELINPKFVEAEDLSRLQPEKKK